MFLQVDLCAPIKISNSIIMLFRKELYCKLIKNPVKLVWDWLWLIQKLTWLSFFVKALFRFQSSMQKRQSIPCSVPEINKVKSASPCSKRVREIMFELSEFAPNSCCDNEVNKAKESNVKVMRFWQKSHFKTYRSLAAISCCDNEINKVKKTNVKVRCFEQKSFLNL